VRLNSAKNDRGDSLSLGIKYFMPSPNDEDAAARKKLEEEAQQQQTLAQLHEMYFGTGSTQNVSSGRDWRYGMPSSAPPPDNTRYLDDSRGLFGIPGLRGAFKGRPQQPKKLISFGDLQPKRKN
jgi:hypothetical protein